MNTTGELPTPQAEPPAVPAPIVPEAAVPPVEPPVAVTEPVAEVAPTAAVKRAPAKPRISDDTLAEWQASLAAAAEAKQQARRAAETAKHRTEGFRLLRAALRRMSETDEEPDDGLHSDRLAVAVHEAPEDIRAVLAVTLRTLSAARKRRR